MSNSKRGLSAECMGCSPKCLFMKKKIKYSITENKILLAQKENILTKLKRKGKSQKKSSQQLMIQF